MASRFCPFCAAPAEFSWRFCQACGGGLPDTAAIERDDRVASLWRQAMHQMEVKDYGPAQETMSALSSAGCSTGDLAALRGSLALRQAKIDDARVLLEEALEEAPSSPFVRLMRAEYWRLIGLTPRAIEELTDGLRLAESERSRNQIRKALERLKKESRWNFSRASPWRR